MRELLGESGMPQDQLSMQCSLPKSIIGNIVNCQYDSVELHIIHEICQGLKINIQEFSHPICLTTRTIWNCKTSGAPPEVSSIREIGTVIYMNKAGCFYEKTTGYYYLPSCITPPGSIRGKNRRPFSCTAPCPDHPGQNPHRVETKEHPSRPAASRPVPLASDLHGYCVPGPSVIKGSVEIQ